MLRLAKSVKYRLGATLGFCIVLLIIGGAVGIVGIKQANDDLVAVYEHNVLSMQRLARMNGTLLAMRGQGLSALARRSVEAGQSFKETFDGSESAIRQSWANYFQEVKPGDTEFEEARAIESDLPRLWQAYTPYVNAMAQGDFDRADTLASGDARILMVSVTKGLANLLDASVAHTRDAYEQSVASYQLMRNLIIAAILAVTVLITLLTVRLIRSIVRPLGQAGTLVDRITAGKLNNHIEITSRDEFGNMLHGLQRMDARLTEIVTGFRSGAEAVSSASRQLARGNDDLSRRTQEQAASLEQTAASMEEMTATVKQNADNAGEADRLADNMGQQAEHGGSVVTRAIEAMQEINTSSRRIADIVGMIDDIAFQTNLLALNAAVEAARAGEQGRGFAVVASEVRNLAGRAAEAAREIKTLVTDSVTRIDNGSALVNQSGQTLAEIVASVNRVSGLFSEIASASREQSSGIEQVGTAVVQMDQLTQQNAALVDKAAESSRQLREQAEALLRQVSFFRVTGSNAVIETDNQAIKNKQFTNKHPIAESRAATRSAERPRQVATTGRHDTAPATASSGRPFRAAGHKPGGTATHTMASPAEEEWETF